MIARSTLSPIVKGCCYSYSLNVGGGLSWLNSLFFHLMVESGQERRWSLSTYAWLNNVRPFAPVFYILMKTSFRPGATRLFCARCYS